MSWSGGVLRPKAPRAEKRRHVDPYAWLRERDDLAVRAHLEAENAYTESMTAHLADLRRRLFDEMLARIQEDDHSVPARHGPYAYYWRTEKGRPYRTYARVRLEEGAAEEVLLDVNRLAEGHDYTQLGALEVSPDHRLLAYSVDHDGSEQHQLRVLEITTGAHLPVTIERTDEVAWANDNQTIFYTVIDSACRPHRLYRHVLGSDPESDVRVFDEPDASFYLGGGRTRSDRLLVLTAESAVTSEQWVLEADQPMGAFTCLAERRSQVEYDIVHHGDCFFVRSNLDAPNFRLLEAPVGGMGFDTWREVVPHRRDVTLEGVEAFADFLVLWERKDALPVVRIRNLRDSGDHTVVFEGEAYEVSSDANYEFDTDTFRLTYTDLDTLPTVLAYKPESRERETLKQLEVRGYDQSRWVAERRWATAPDGERVPISLVRARQGPLDGSAPLLLHGYGAYGALYEPSFESTRLSLLERGVTIGVAHVRGGGDLGRRWKDGGKLEHKPHTFSDFIACAEYLIEAGYTSGDRLAIEGRSAGGLLVGAVLNQRPDLFQAAIAGVPFVDVVNTLLDETLPLTVLEWEEWGDPRDPRFGDLIRSYSPYDNVRAQTYPTILATAGFNDPRVQYWEPAKWVARLREHQQGEAPILLKTDLETGHGGRSGRYGRLEDLAFEYAFILEALGRAIA